MGKKVISFDLDDTLAVTKSPISDEMAGLLSKLLEYYEVHIISGGKYEQFQKQVIERLEIDDKKLNKLHLMPTCGTRYYKYDSAKSYWALIYSEDLSSEQKQEIVKVLEESAKEVGLWAENPYGEIIEDRGSQITYSALGQQAPADEKYKWASENEEVKKKLRDLVASRLEGLEVRLGGTTSIDITRVGIDKAYGMNKLIEALSIDKSDILFIGDKLEEGGNDYPVKAMGVDTIAVHGWEDTAFVLRGILSSC